MGAIAAGNAAMVKPSELAPASSALLADALPAYVDTGAIKIVQGGHDVNDRLLQFKWDKIFFTGMQFHAFGQDTIFASDSFVRGI